MATSEPSNKEQMDWASFQLFPSFGLTGRWSRRHCQYTHPTQVHEYHIVKMQISILLYHQDSCLKWIRDSKLNTSSLTKINHQIKWCWQMTPFIWSFILYNIQMSVVPTSKLDGTALNTFTEGIGLSLMQLVCCQQGVLLTLNTTHPGILHVNKNILLPPQR